jgi:hypothetical protein
MHLWFEKINGTGSVNGWRALDTVTVDGLKVIPQSFGLAKNTIVLAP